MKEVDVAAENKLFLFFFFSQPIKKIDSISAFKQDPAFHGCGVDRDQIPVVVGRIVGERGGLISFFFSFFFSFLFFFLFFFFFFSSFILIFSL